MKRIRSGYSRWGRVPQDIFFSIIEKTNYFDYHCMSAVCSHWRSGCKNFSSFNTKFPRLPNKEIPWRLTNKVKLECYIPLASRTYEIDIPELYGFSMSEKKDYYGASCLYSKDGWLLLLCNHKKTGNKHDLLLLDIFTRDMIELPKVISLSIINQGTFLLSTERKPNHVVLVTRYGALHTWKKGTHTWERIIHWFGGSELSRIWFSNEDKLLYYFPECGRCCVFNTDFQCVRDIPGILQQIVRDRVMICENELFTQGYDDVIYKFSRSTLTWNEVDEANNLIWFSSSAVEDPNNWRWLRSSEEEMDVGCRVMDFGLRVTEQTPHKKLLEDLQSNGCVVRCSKNGGSTITIIYDLQGQVPCTWVNVG